MEMRRACLFSIYTGLRRVDVLNFTNLQWENVHKHCKSKAFMHLTLADADIDKHITFHCFRHTFAMQLLDKGVDIYTIATLLVHNK